MNQMAKDTVEDAVEMNFSAAELQRYSPKSIFLRSAKKVSAD